MKQCSKCKEEKPLDGFYFRKESGKHRNECTECTKALRSKHRRDNPEAVNATNRKHWHIRKLSSGYREFLKSDAKEFTRKAGSHNNRAKQDFGLSERLLSSEIRRLYNNHGWACYYCGKLVANTTNLELDHVIPLEVGGRNHISNCVPACTHCNRTKHTKTEQEFLISRNQGAEV